MSKLILPSRRPNVCIGVTTYNGDINSGLALPIGEWTHHKNYKATCEFLEHQIPLDNARNRIVEGFLEHDEFTHLMILDADLRPAIDSLDLLLAADKDCIAPLIFTVKNDPNGNPCPTPLIFRKDENDVAYINCKAEGVTRVDLIPGGMCLIKREVIESVPKPLFGYEYNDKGWCIKGTDEVFSDKLVKYGYKLWIHTGAYCEQVVPIGTIAFNNTLIAAAEKFSRGEVIAGKGL